MAIPYQTTKFKSTNIFAMAIWGPTTKFNSRQYSGFTVSPNTAIIMPGNLKVVLCV